MRKRWLFVPVLVGALAFSLIGLAFLPQVNEEESESRFGDYAARVASILGLEADTVQDAMKQAKQELAAEALQEKLDAMVASGDITQAEADEYKAWVEAKPEGSFWGFKPRGIDAGELQEKLDAMVADGEITQEKADEYKAYVDWMESRPESFDQFYPGHRGKGFAGGWGRGYDKEFCKDKGAYEDKVTNTAATPAPA